MRTGAVRRLHGAGESGSNAVVHASGRARQRERDRHTRRTGDARASSPGAEGVYRGPGLPVRILPEWLGVGHQGAARQAFPPNGRSKGRRVRGVGLPLRQPCADRGRGADRGESVTMTASTSASRRGFLKAGGGLLIGFSLSDSRVLPQLIAAETSANPLPGRLDAWLRVGSDGNIRVFTGKVDIGMGVQTGLNQIVADELDVAFERIHLVMGDTAETPDQGGTGGSTSIAAGAKPLRNAAASARFMMLQLASVKLGAPPEQLQVKDGVVSVRGDASSKNEASRSISYAALAGAAGGTDLNEALRVSGAGFALNVEGSGK